MPPATPHLTRCPWLPPASRDPQSSPRRPGSGTRSPFPGSEVPSVRPAPRRVGGGWRCPTVGDHPPAGRTPRAVSHSGSSWGDGSFHGLLTGPPGVFHPAGSPASWLTAPCVPVLPRPCLAVLMSCVSQRVPPLPSPRDTPRALEVPVRWWLLTQLPGVLSELGAHLSSGPAPRVGRAGPCPCLVLSLELGGVEGVTGPKDQMWLTAWCTALRVPRRWLPVAAAEMSWRPAGGWCVQLGCGGAFRLCPRHTDSTALGLGPAMQRPCVLPVSGDPLLEDRRLSLTKSLVPVAPRVGWWTRDPQHRKTPRHRNPGRRQLPALGAVAVRLPRRSVRFSASRGLA